jgi:hypothetical protein
MTPELSRRQLLTATGLTLGIAWVELGAGAAPAAATSLANAPSGLTLEAVPDQPVPVLSADGTGAVAVPRQLAVKIVNNGIELTEGTRLTVTFDHRIYAVMNSPLVTLGSRKIPATATTENDAQTGLTVCTVILSERIPARSATTGDLIVLLGTANPHLYPRDLITRPADATADVARTGRTPAAHRGMKPPRPSSFGGVATAWGVEIAGGWDMLTWGTGGRYWYRYPVMASITGTGPGRTPAIEFMVTADPRVVTDVTVVSARLNDSPYSTSKIAVDRSSTTETVRQIRWRTGVRLDAGDRLDVGLRVSTRAPRGALDTITHPVVSIDMGADTAARQTGRTSVSRTDSSWQ